MPRPTERRWAPRWGALMVWALVAASAAYWSQPWWRPPGAPMVPPVARPPLAIDASAVARALGAGAAPAPTAAPTPVATRYTLQGVLAGRDSGGGAALIAVDNQPARPYRLGSEVAPGLRLLALGPREARLGPSAEGPATVVLELPKPPAAAGG